MACVFVTENFWSRGGTRLVTENFWSWSDSQLCNLCGVIWTIIFANAAAIIGVPQKLVLDNATVEPR